MGEVWFDFEEEVHVMVKSMALEFSPPFPSYATLGKVLNACMP